MGAAGGGPGRALLPCATCASHRSPGETPARRPSRRSVMTQRRRLLCHSRNGKALDLVMERQKPLARQVEAVVGLQLAVGDVDEDLLLEIEQLDDGQGVSVAVDGAQVVAGVWEVGSGRQQEVVLPGVAGEEGGGEVGAGNREADAHVATVLVPEARVDPDVDRLA